jgi:hypothetical protein
MADPATSLFNSIGPASYGLNPASAGPNSATSTAPSLAQIAGPIGTAAAPLWSPDNPLFWFGAILAVAVGLIGVSTHVRVGPFSAGAAAGDKPCPKGEMT